jgi:hypothetical protein
MDRQNEFETANKTTNDIQIFFCDVGEDVPRVKGLLDEAVVVLREAQTIKRLIEIRGSHNEECQVGTVVGRYVFLVNRVNAISGLRAQRTRVRDRRRSISSHVRDFLRCEDVIPRNHRCMWVFDGIEVPICPGPGSCSPAIEPIGL